MHVAGVPQLAQSRINDRYTGVAALPIVQLGGAGIGPAEAIEARIEVLVRRLRKMVQQVVGKITPAKLAQISINVGIGAGAAQAFQRMGDTPWRDLAEMQVWRHPRGTYPVRQIALLAIAAKGAILEH